MSGVQNVRFHMFQTMIYLHQTYTSGAISHLALQPFALSSHDSKEEQWAVEELLESLQQNS